MRVYGSNGKRSILFDEEETSFSEAKSDSESLITSQDQTMVEGQLSSENLMRWKLSAQGNSQVPADYPYENKVDIFTELNVLREDVKTSIEDVHSKMHAFDGKINRVLDLLQKVTFDQSEIKRRVNESFESISDSIAPGTDVNDNQALRSEEEKPMDTRQKASMKKRSKTGNDDENAVDTFFIVQETGKRSQNVKLDHRTSFSKRKISKEEGATKKVKGESSSKRDSTTEGKAQKRDVGKEDSSVKKEAGKEKQGSNRVLPEKETGNKVSKSKQNKLVMKQPKERPMVDDLDELERELEEIGFPNESFDESTVKKPANSRTVNI